MSARAKIHDRVAPRQQTNWDARAAANFICGGAGGSLMLATGVAATMSDDDLRPLAIVALALVGLGLNAVFFEIGRPSRALNVFRHVSTSWMTREAWIALVLFCVGGAALLLKSAPMLLAAGGIGLGFVFAQGRMLEANKGIAAFRQKTTVALIVSTGLAEGFGLLTVASLHWPALRVFSVALAALLAVRFLVWRAYIGALREGNTPAGALKAFAAIAPLFVWAGHFAPIVLALTASLDDAGWLAAPAGALAAVTGAALKHTLICRAAFTQGFVLPKNPRRGGAPKLTKIQDN
ncbi:hypothetical protein CCR94_19070 [Rhodoblastus sphagnicola]|uniref:Phenylacetyl-CoA:acceptor oxidoreductase n=1 Tax=Rhodoblastus sphagnicola TaxID=333368 RepID=A0A2S6N006_9HYPH|nr:DmsC/YnfH family molybdoenzyme membrane anchor subunit [Rhodoblastus sphagnicola]MBB4197897.1 phenylacetyl-CoA:acceptor oxidoreductase subunit 2 [Rhodoblastus sphagnicola]PPQ27954.1 hypothetical protein CCR94_19070 [Rhodoblastus sphagnicola]